MSCLRSVVLPLALLLLLPGTTLAQPTVSIDEDHFMPGDPVLLTVTGYTPGDYIASVRWDGEVQIQFWIPAGGSTTYWFTIPFDATPGGHTLEVCAACDQGDLAQTSSVQVYVETGELVDTEWNVQVEAIEVTQGVRGPIPRRNPPDDSLTFPGDGTVLVANRRTVVRVYPWIEAGDGRHGQYVAATLYASLDGMPLPSMTGDPLLVNKFDSFEDRRSDAVLTWNFELPRSWVAVPASQESRTLSFAVEINPVGPLHKPDEHNVTDNLVHTGNHELRHVGLDNQNAMLFRPYLIAEVNDEGTVIRQRTTRQELVRAVESLHEILPVGERTRGIQLITPRDINTPFPRPEDNDEILIRTFLPTGTLEGNPPNDFHAFLVNTLQCGGHAYVSTPYLITGACGAPVYQVAHELAHAIGRPHAGDGHGEKGPDPTYPGDHGQVELDAWGFDHNRGISYTPDDPFQIDFSRHDYMSYAPLKNSRQVWSSRYTWDKVALELGQPLINTKGIAKDEEIPVETLALTGWFDGSTLDVSPLYAIPKAPVTNAGTGLALRFVAEDGSGLGVSRPNLHHNSDETNSRTFVSGVLSAPVTWDRIDVVHNQQVLHSIQRSDNAPTCGWATPSGFAWGATGTQTLTWWGQDADNDDLFYRIVGYREGDRHVLATDLDTTTWDLDLASLPGGGTWELFVEVSDGFRHGVSEQIVGTAAWKAPQPLLMFPFDSETYSSAREMAARGIYTDFQEDPHDTTWSDVMEWRLDGNFLGEGPWATLPTLTPGTYTLELTAQNSAGLAGSMQATFTIVDGLVAPTIVSPGQGSSVVSPTALMEWDPVPGATSYRIGVYWDEAMTQPVVEDPALTVNVFEFEIPVPGRNYHWKVAAQDRETVSDAQTASFWAGSSTSAPGLQASAASLRLAPNPFNPRTTFSFKMPRSGHAALVIFDTMGRRVRTLVDGSLGPGIHRFVWDGTDQRGRSTASGVYLARLVSEGVESTARAVLLK